MNCTTGRLHRVLFSFREFAGVAMVSALLLAMRGDALAQDNAVGPAKVTAWLRVGDAPAALNNQFRNPAEYEAYRKTQAARIKSPLVLQNALRKLSEEPQLTVLREQKEPQRWLEDHLIVTAPLEQELIQISMADVDPQQAVKIVNAVRDSYMETVVDSEQKVNLQRFNLLQESLAQLKTDLVRKQDMLSELTRPNSQLFEERDLAREHRSNLERLLINVRERQLEIDLQVASAKTRLAMVVADSLDAAKAKIDLAVAEAQQEILKNAKDEFTSELEHAVADTVKLAQAGTKLADLKAAITGLQKAADKRENEVRDAKLQLELPPRVQALEKATVGEK